MNRTSMLLKWQAVPNVDVIVQDDKVQLVVLEKASCLFAFNFHPCDEISKYKIPYWHPGSTSGTELSAVLNSDDLRFGGEGRIAATVEVEKDNHVTLTLPPRTAVVFASKDAVNALECDKVLALTSVDDFVEALKLKTCSK